MKGDAGSGGRADASAASVLSVNVGGVRTVMLGERPIQTAIWKAPVSGPVAVRGVNLAGDRQADRSVHGGPDKAVYTYAGEDHTWWEERLGRPVLPGTFGENLTTAGVNLAAAVVGERWAVGTTVLEVAQPRIPCFKLGIRMGDPRFPARFAAAGRPGAYLRIVAEGEVAAGDEIRVVSRPDHGLTVGMVERAYHQDRTLIPRLLDAPGRPESWIDWAQRVLRARTA
jgi:MOSC domain-containing protein YiiM